MRFPPSYMLVLVTFVCVALPINANEIGYGQSGSIACKNEIYLVNRVDYYDCGKLSTKAHLGIKVESRSLPADYPGIRDALIYQITGT
ncbi:hypothetical protein CC78DRAFT_575516 [Lojkania enalia]|uniref:Uncharacterized protein n=1 Tax=Lojkania enalia TaxID=147567 RepID=A0A9P4KHV5_9PLEO|nr:hypothetical protein CC78DRAFT_575516 [Didymosphaeria enalia]